MAHRAGRAVGESESIRERFHGCGEEVARAHVVGRRGGFSCELVHFVVGCDLVVLPCPLVVNLEELAGSLEIYPRNLGVSLPVHEAQVTTAAGVGGKLGDMAIPATTYVLGTIGALFLFRGIWFPNRAVVKKGTVSACAGSTAQGCDPSMHIVAEKGTKVFAAGGGKVLSVGPDWMHIQVTNEPVILFYQGVKPGRKEGSHVFAGQKIGESDGALMFGVWELTQDTGEGVDLVPVEPASWLAARGMKIAMKEEGDGGLWCTEKRHLIVPKDAHGKCKLRNPRAAGFALLPVSIEQE